MTKKIPSLPITTAAAWGQTIPHTALSPAVGEVVGAKRATTTYSSGNDARALYDAAEEAEWQAMMEQYGGGEWRGHYAG